MNKIMTLLVALTVGSVHLASAKTVVPIAAPTGASVSVSKTVVDAPLIKAMFTPDDNVQAELVRLVKNAQKQVRVQAYVLTDDKITDALIAAHKRGVDVRVLMDAVRSQGSKGSDAVKLSQARIPVRLETTYENAHNKIIIIDQSIVVTGSYNFTYAAQFKNAENVLVIQNAPSLVARYMKNWQRHHDAAIDYKIND